MHSERGNILFLILLAIILFAALAFAIRQSADGGKNASDESTKAEVSEIQNYFASLDTAVQRMMMTGNVKDHELNFYYLSHSRFIYGGVTNPYCTSAACRVFDPAGGGVLGRQWEKVSKRSYVHNDPNTAQYVAYVAVPGLGTVLPETVYTIKSPDINVCKGINAAAGLGSTVFLNVSYITIGNSAHGNPYQQGFGPVPIVETVALSSNLPFAAAQAGTFCWCSDATEAACIANAWAPEIFHVLHIR